MTKRRTFLKATGLTALSVLASQRVMEAAELKNTAPFNEVKALTFDVFGTVVDWRSSIIREGEALGKRKGLTVDWPRFADEWAKGYGSSIQRVRNGELPWTTVEVLLRMVLIDLLNEFGISGLISTELDDFARVWQRLTPWPDSVTGLKSLRAQRTIATLSNGNISMLTKLSQYAGISWDHIFSAEHVKLYKPDQEVYLTAARMLKLEPAQIMMVAAHPQDLLGASRCGFRTALVMRPLEWGAKSALKYNPDKQPFDLIVKELHELTEKI